MKKMFNPVRQIGNTVLPALPPQPNMPKFPSFDLAADSLPAFNAMQNSIVPVGPRPSGDYMPNIPVLRIPESNIGAENHLPTLMFNRSVQENFGGDPRYEAQQMAHRPTNPRTLGVAPQVKVAPTSKQVSVFEKTLIPKANMPHMADFRKMIRPTGQITIESRTVQPPVRGADMGGLLSSTSTIGGFGMTPGRAFGAESFLINV
tara:strand:+ start:1848 stop:2459 length:612 start_codon:yes stop_codon:yes gene_type:complete